MKGYLPPLAVLAVILAFSFWNFQTIETTTTRWTAQLESADQMAQNGDWEKARSLLSDSYQDWCSQRNYLQTVAHHEIVDGAEAMYRRAEAFALTEEPNEFRAEVADLQDQIRLLLRVEQLNWGNVL